MKNKDIKNVMKTIIRISIFACLMLTLQFATAQVGVGTALPNASAQLEVVANNKGVLLPQVALIDAADATSIPSGNVTSLLVYNTATAGTAPLDVTPGYYYWGGTRWLRITTSADTDAVKVDIAATAPTSPKEGDIWINNTNTNNTIAYAYDADTTAWVALEDNDNVTTANTAPTNPAIGDIWRDNTNTNIIVSYVWDGTAWVATGNTGKEPWYGNDNNDEATENTEDIYSMGNV